MLNSSKKIINSLTLVLIGLFGFNSVQSQVFLDNWKTHTSLLNIRAASVDSKGLIWYATSGGAFSYNPATGNIEEYRNLNGLLTVNLSTVRCNPETKSIFFGAQDGTLDISGEGNIWTHFTEIKKETKFPKPFIKDIAFIGNRVYIAGGFGLTIFKNDEKTFDKTVVLIGNFQPNTTVNQILINGDDIWLATDAGLARASLNSSIQNPEVWKNYTKLNGLPDLNVPSIAFYQGSLYAATPTSICRLENDSFIVIKKFESWKTIFNITNFGNKLIYSSQFEIKDLDDSLYFTYDNSPSKTPFTGHIVYRYGGKEKIILFLEKNSFLIFDDDGPKHVVPGTPYSNSFLSMAVDETGTLWATGDENSKTGIMKYENGVWENINTIKHPQIISNDYWAVSPGNNNRIFFGNYGKGLLLIEKQDNNLVYKIFDNTNSPLESIVGGPGYTIASKAAIDKRNGITWIVNYGVSSIGTLLVPFDQGGNFLTSFPLRASGVRKYYGIAIDENGTKWLASRESNGLYYFNENGTFNNPADDKSGIFSPSNSQLTNESQNCVAVDKSGVIWVGTPTGLTSIINPGAVLKNTTPIIRKVNLLGYNWINDIVIDALNNKWIATNEGLIVLNADGTEITANFNINNSPLLSNTIKSLAYDPKTGKVFFGTIEGLTEASSLAVEPAKEFSITCFPQPFYPERDIYTYIDGLASDANVHIVTLNGELIKRITTQSRKAVWDGRNESGELVPTGIYMILGSSATAEDGDVGKIAVIRN